MILQRVAQRELFVSNTFGEWLTATRNKRGVSQNLLAQKAGTNSPMVSMLESGKRSPSRDMVDKLALALCTEDMTQEDCEALRDEALLAAGFVPEGRTLAPVAEVERIPDLPEVVHLYSGLSPQGRAATKRMIEALYAAERGEAHTPEGEGES